eukprot:TRINITY_DN18406_c1_g1_i2.p1 TRINITY_DN18406_c1_g1~~TRINITY_DN18406_c1_g1_i2.p1  ORF type:complete len:288 (-),score=25.08 TRINITY_DN18406_c1_g1_i2:427-1290(-)
MILLRKNLRFNKMEHKNYNNYTVLAVGDGFKGNPNKNNRNTQTNAIGSENTFEPPKTVPLQHEIVVQPNSTIDDVKQSLYPGAQIEKISTLPPELEDLIKKSGNNTRLVAQVKLKGKAQNIENKRRILGLTMYVDLNFKTPDDLKQCTQNLQIQQEALEQSINHVKDVILKPLSIFQLPNCVWTEGTAILFGGDFGHQYFAPITGHCFYQPMAIAGQMPSEHILKLAKNIESVHGLNLEFISIQGGQIKRATISFPGVYFRPFLESFSKEQFLIQSQNFNPRFEVCF